MTPKEKAKELVDKMHSKMYSDGIYDAKQCALICVDEIIEEIKEWNMSVIDYQNRIEYWQEVKQEIEKQ